jgi:5S rRNA maturation endonuclease (ribonuclease M5)
MKQFNEAEIKYIQDRACERVSEILDALGVEYFERSDYLQGRCPCHSGDNHRSFYFATRTSHWRCNTKHCHKNPISGNSTSIFGLIRGAMSNKLNRRFTFIESVIFAATILNLSDLKMDEETAENIEIFKIIKQYRVKKSAKENGLIPLSTMLPSLVKDTTYYPTRGVDENTISKYHISSCNKKNKLFFERSFFPILDISGKYVVGWSGRSIWGKCDSCKMFHNPIMDCPPKHKCLFYEKWLHSKGFKKELYLYNYWFAKYSISKTGTAIVVESPGNVWAMEMAGIKNSISLMGPSMSKEQRILLQKAGALTLILIMDNDKTGTEATETLMEELNYYFRIIPVNLERVNDVAELNSDDIKEQIGKVLKDNTKEFLLKDN